MSAPSQVSDFLAARVVVRRRAPKWAPPPRLSLSEWADQHFYLSAESAAEPGRWHTLPYQKGILDAITDPTVEQVSVMKSARVGYTKCMNAAIGYHMHQAPCPILVVQPTVDDAKGYSKEEIAPMLRDCPELARIVFEDAEDIGPKDAGNTILHKKFPGGVLSMVGANSGAGFRRVSRKVVLFDEVDGYPPSAGSDGDQIKLGIKRSEFYWDRKIIAGSTPLVSGHSRIESLFEAGDQRRYYVPCPECGHMAPLVFSGDKGHVMRWPEDEPEKAFFECQARGCVIEHAQKREIVERGEWRATAETKRLASGRLHASFHIWAAYSFSPNASWAQLASEFLEARKLGPEALKTFINTALGETWRERGEAPDWERLFARREQYPIGTVPDGVQFLTAGVDVQKDRVLYEVVGWGAGKESWSIDAGPIMMDIGNEADWPKLDELLNRTYSASTGARLAILVLGIDSGFNTQAVYNWSRRHSLSRVMATKGVKTARTLVGAPSPVDLTWGGKRISRGYKVWPIGSDIGKAELYSQLRLSATGAPFPAGFCHFPEWSEDFFKQLTGEQLVSVVNERTGFTIHEWQLIPGRENHHLDARVIARVCAAQAGLDRMAAKAPRVAPVAEAPPTVVHIAPVAPAAATPPRPRSDSRFFGKRGKGWLR